MNKSPPRGIASYLVRSAPCYASLPDAVSYGGIYYVDATMGDDNNPGAQESPWKTINKVNTSKFLPGAEIYFKRGETWDGGGLVVPSSGTEDNPIGFGAYGIGAKPVIDGNDTAACIVASNQAHLRFTDIEVKRSSAGGFQFQTCSHIVVENCDAHHCAGDNLIFITGCSHSEVHGGSFYASTGLGAGAGSGIEIADGSHDITIDGAECYDQSGGGAYGMTIHCHYGAGLFPYNITVQNCTMRDNAGTGINLAEFNTRVTDDCHILIDNCLVLNNAIIGINITSVANAAVNGVTITQCTVRDNGVYQLYIVTDDIQLNQCVIKGTAPILMRVNARSDD